MLQQAARVTFASLPPPASLRLTMCTALPAVAPRRIHWDSMVFWCDVPHAAVNLCCSDYASTLISSKPPWT